MQNKNSDTILLDTNEVREFVIEMPLRYARKKKWYTKKNGDRDYYIVDDETKIVSDDFYRIPRTSCRVCKGDNSKPYSNIYYEEELGSFNTIKKFKYCHSLGYCEECAKKKAKRHLDPFDNLEIVSRKRWSLCGDNGFVHYETELTDGSIVESYDGFVNKCLER